MKNKKLYSILFAILFGMANVFAQISSEGFHYKTKLTDNSGNPVANQSVDIQFTISDAYANIFYAEGHSTTTDANGIVDVIIGEGTPILGDFTYVDWTVPLYLNVQMNFGSGWVDFGTQPFKYVPYAKYADMAGWAFGIDFSDIVNVPADLADGDDTGATKIDELSDGKTDASGSSVFLGFEAGNSDDGTNNNNTGLGYRALRNTTSGSNNTGVGASALIYNTTGSSNSAFGSAALLANTTGSKNTSIGFESMVSNTNGSENTAMGYRALTTNTTGNYNTAIGFESLKNNTSGTYNTALGYKSLLGNTNGHNGSYNVAVGYQSLKNNQTADYNVAVGPYAMESNTLGDHNTAVGVNALKTNDEGDYNVALGSNALASSTNGDLNIAIGFAALKNANNLSEMIAIGDSAMYNATSNNSGYAFGNTAIGSKALFSNTIGKLNTAIGYKALYATTEGMRNTAVGNQALMNNTSGNRNTAVGFKALKYITTKVANTAIGDLAGPTGDYDNTTSIGFYAGRVFGADNRIEIGNNNVVWIGGQVTWSTFSDRRIKRNVKENVPGLEFIKRLRPVTYHIDAHKQEELIARGDKKRLEEMRSIDWPSKYDIEKITMTGFIAQEVEQAAKEIGYDFSGVQKADDDPGMYSISYAQFVVPLVKAVQELSEKVNKLENENKALKAKFETELAKQRREIEQLKKLLENKTR